MTGRSEISKLAKTPRYQMLKRQPRPLGFICNYSSDAAQSEKNIVHIHYGQVLLANLLPLCAARDPRDDAVALLREGRGLQKVIPLVREINGCFEARD